ncbi:GTP pyrophosphokinase rsh [Serratia rubidaea]|uniref:GTP pyrophosphokinase rsh n=1 Tax=Serratia rubidaea TaxID=61652 RepID=A0A4U9HMU2_SERRU|nr:HD domain-containing protein [Serratia rubidaea]MBS0974922.1 bifunctional (p)ppGpp synthetase/guanosine-3',5'-bis(diphosphate) 3'-pyrophosphohydrolase [Serratia rubidaea]QPR63438.1 bifunctional (p)ppGpp synthetase/guanosine-3',5'-bis(diphosphate) 3'-pyrophosphohydrolase [Serratia rubidaea]CAI0728057.1 GTP pyrophosphokinase rsh [Serratia rubidaea]CAI1535067.1 GTP pyrophosphokinase rsh [Serratia rubidaea]VTP64706.1 GTP pyrophosphokinase rsh [Serratia rubidaea]
MTLSERARIFATQAHADAGQKRKFTDEPYIVHPAAVVELLMSANPSEEMIAAAWLHDVVEDTGVTLAAIGALFGPRVEQYVEMLTDVRTRSSGGERIERKNANLRHSAQAHPSAQTIKLCDLIDNARCVVERDPLFARDYLLEMKRLLTVMTAGDAVLYARALKVCDDGIARLHRQLGNDAWFIQGWARYEQHTPLSAVTGWSGTELSGW